MQELIKNALPQENIMNQAIVEALRLQHWATHKCYNFVVILN